MQIHKLKQRGYKQSQIANHIKDIKFSERKKALTRKKKPQQTDKLVFVTQYTDDIQRIKRIFNKHWKLIKNNPYLKTHIPVTSNDCIPSKPFFTEKTCQSKTQTHKYRTNHNSHTNTTNNITTTD